MQDLCDAAFCSFVTFSLMLKIVRCR